jgi:hypothetical protein
VLDEPRITANDQNDRSKKFVNSKTGFALIRKPWQPMPHESGRRFARHEMRIMKAGAIYFSCVFAVGWMLGPIREVWAVPHFGRTIATLLESPFMLAAMIIAASWITRRFHVSSAPAARVGVGVVALGFLVIADCIGAQWVRGISIKEYLASFAPAPGLISLTMFLLFAVMPMLVSRSRDRGIRAKLPK